MWVRKITEHCVLVSKIYEFQKALRWLEKIAMSKFNTLGIACSPRGIAKDWVIIFFALIERRHSHLIFTLFQDVLEWVNLDSNCISCFNLSGSRLIKWNNTLNWFSQAFFFHCHDFRNVFRRWENARHFSLVKDEVNWLESHWVEKSDCSHWVVHVCDVSNQPLVPILWPDPNKMPLSSIPFRFSCKIKSLNASGYFLSQRFYFAERKPLVVPKLFFVKFRSGS